MFNENITTDGIEESGDRLGGFKVYPSDAYLATIKLIYATESEGGAKGLVCHFDLDGEEYRETLWPVGKNGHNYYEDKNGKKQFLMGYTVANDMMLFATGKPLTEQTWEEKEVKIYNKETKAEEPKAAMVAVDALGQKVMVGLLQKERWKSVKTDNGYVDSDEKQLENSIDKMFHPENFATVTEITKQLPVGDFYTKWLEKNKDVTRPAPAKKGNAGGGTAGRPPAANGGASGAPQRSQSNDMFKR